MLVLTRKVKQEFSFVNLGITIEILRVSGKKVQVGVVAPEHVRVLRSELLRDDADARIHNAAQEQRHALRNKLNTVSLAMSILQAHLQAGRIEEAEQSLTTTLSQLSELDLFVGTIEPIIDEAPLTKRKRRALVVEDNAQERELLAEYLRVHGFDVSVAEDGEQALDYLAQHHVPDVVLLDMNMPKMNGSNTAKAIRCDPRFQNLKLFVISGSEPVQTDAEANLPYDQWFSKPIRPQEFVLELETQLGSAC
ncbi:response regulator [Rhodopirellula baltica]|uniref:response regulator n=1 Tax=Rhodopirellula baltica TaxID=265606 RepID=UPI0009DA786E|nr:response regulator [Rhodopirellula baltica]